MKAIIQQPAFTQQTPAWQNALSEMVTSPTVLLGLLNLQPEAIDWQWDPNFPLRVTRSFIDRMKKGDPQDPLLRQVLSLKIESQLDDGYSEDPLSERNAIPVPGVLHKFPNRVLLTFTSSCAIHCRYCFRRHFPYQENNMGRKGLATAMDYIRRNPQIVEVILSGGDPLMAQDQYIAECIQQLNQIPHLNIVRFHTRLPVVIPERISPSFLRVIESATMPIVMVYHINHPNEITPQIKEGVAQLKRQGVTVLNQSVLLKNVNDNVDCLKGLSLSLFEAGILPYYVNLLDKVQGASHFWVPLAQAHALQKSLREQLPGYLVPKFVTEIPHRLSKTPFEFQEI